MWKFYALIAFLFNIYVTYAKRTGGLFKRITTFVETIDVLYLHSLDCKIHINSIIQKVLLDIHICIFEWKTSFTWPNTKWPSKTFRWILSIKVIFLSMIIKILKLNDLTTYEIYALKILTYINLINKSTLTYNCTFT